MQYLTGMLDKLAIGLSFLCVAHCLLLPFAILLLPALGAAFLEEEVFHYWLLFLVVPTSMFSLWLGCRKHGNPEILAIGVFGLCLLMLIVALGVDLLGETSERISTVAGAAIIALAHLKNMKACKKAEKEYA
ncbi:MAG: MerC domain-containing protein [Gammaproteobacteria bacterium]